MRFLKAYLTFWTYLVLATHLLYALTLHASYIFTQVHFFEIVVGLCVVPMLYLWIFDRGSRPGLSLITSAFIAFVAISALLNLFGVNPLQSFTGVWERFGSLRDWLYMLFYFFLLRTVVRTDDQMRRYLRFAVYISIPVCLFALAQYSSFFGLYTAGERIFSTLGNPAFLASYLFLASGMTLYLAVTDRTSWPFFLSIIFSLQVITIALTFTRSVLIATSLASFIALATACANTKKDTEGKMRLRETLFWSLLLCLCVSITVFLSLPPSPANRGRFFGSGIIDQSAKTREATWKIGLRGFLERPLTGWGNGNYEVVFQRFYDPSIYYGTENTPFFDRAHNEFIDRLVEGGMIGFGAYCVLLFAPLLLLAKKKKLQDESMLLRVVYLLGYYGYLFFFFHSIADTMLFVLLLASFELRVEDVPKKKENLLFISFAAIVIGIGTAAAVNLKPLVANYLVHAAETAEASEQRLTLYRGAWEVSKESHRPSIDSLAGILSNRVPGSIDAETLEQLREWTADVVNQNPYNTRYVVLLARIYRLTAAHDPSRLAQSLSLLETAQKLSPSDPDLYKLHAYIQYDMAQTAAPESGARQFQETARDDLLHALVLQPETLENQLLYAAASGIVTGSFDELMVSIKRAKTLITPADWRLLFQIMASQSKFAVLDMLRTELTQGVLKDLPNAAALQEEIKSYRGN